MNPKIAFTLAILFATAIVCAARLEEHAEFSIIGIEYVGKSNKPITPIVISDSEPGAEWFRSSVLKRSELELTYVHIVSRTLIAKLIGDTETYSSLAQKGKRSNATISITVVSRHATNTLLLTTEHGLGLLRILEKECRNDQAVYSDLRDFGDQVAHLNPARTTLKGGWSTLPTGSQHLSYSLPSIPMGGALFADFAKGAGLLRNCLRSGAPTNATFPQPFQNGTRPAVLVLLIAIDNMWNMC